MKNQPHTRKYHFIYKTTRINSDAYYIGMHSADVLEDSYLGSGIILNSSIKKYGRAAHKREVLELLPSREALKIREAELLTPEVLLDPMCMNITSGGGGGGIGINNSFFGRNHTVESKLKIVATRIGVSLKNDHKEKLSKASSEGLSKHYLITRPDGSTDIVKGLKRFCQENDLVYPTLFATIKKGVPSGGWLVRRVQESAQPSRDRGSEQQRTSLGRSSHIVRGQSSKQPTRDSARA